jgi:hypothetical protein
LHIILSEILQALSSWLLIITRQPFSSLAIDFQAGLITNCKYEENSSITSLVGFPMEKYRTLPDKLNTFLTRFEDNTVPPTWPATKDCGLSFSVADVSKIFKRVNPGKAASPDSVPSWVLRACPDQLDGVFTDIFNLSLSQSAVPTCFKMAAIVPVPKKAKVTELNDYRPVALTSVIMKCFERLAKDHITSPLPVTLDPLQFAY